MLQFNKLANTGPTPKPTATDCIRFSWFDCEPQAHEQLRYKNNMRASPDILLFVTNVITALSRSRQEALANVLAATGH
jgi:hypothetical protein